MQGLNGSGVGWETVSLMGQSVIVIVHRPVECVWRVQSQGVPCCARERKTERRYSKISHVVPINMLRNKLTHRGVSICLCVFFFSGNPNYAQA